MERSFSETIRSRKASSLECLKQKFGEPNSRDKFKIMRWDFEFGSIVYCDPCGYVAFKIDGNYMSARFNKPHFDQDFIFYLDKIDRRIKRGNKKSSTLRNFLNL